MQVSTQATTQVPRVCQFVAYGEGRDSGGYSPEGCTCPLLALAGDGSPFSLLISLSLSLSLSSLLAEGVDLGARPYYCKPEEFLRKVIFCSSTSVHRALWGKLRHEAEALTKERHHEHD